MQILINGRNLEITQEIRERVEKELSHAVTNNVLSITSINVVIEKVKFNYKISIVLHALHQEFIATLEDADLTKAIAKAAEKIDIQITKVLDKLHDIHGKNERIAEVTSDREETEE